MTRPWHVDWVPLPLPDCVGFPPFGVFVPNPKLDISSLFLSILLLATVGCVIGKNNFILIELFVSFSRFPTVYYWRFGNLVIHPSDLYGRNIHM